MVAVLLTIIILIDLQAYLYSKPQAILENWQQEQQLANTVENRRTVGRIRFSQCVND